MNVFVSCLVLSQPARHPQPLRTQQRGGTFLGLVIGLVVGLAMALAVAVYVTKVPVPFINKGQSRSAEQDAAEAKKNKDWDPNAPLYGKNPAKPAAIASAPASPASAASAPAVANNPAPPAAPPAAASAAKAPTPAADAKTDTKADAKPAASADPLGDLARAKSSNSAPEPFTYFVQTGAYRTPEDAEAQRAKLSLSGFEAKVTEREQSGRAVFRVRVGPFDRKEDADKIKEKLDSSGLDTAMVRVQR
jgi:cell division protein FtsN